MKIIGLKSAVVEGNFDWTFVRVETDEGIHGLGECFFALGLTSILRSLEPVIGGEDPRDIHRLFRKLQLGVSGAGSVAGMFTTPSAESKRPCGTCWDSGLTF
jgi:L-alanine-DL-glutamate epimerase-like enolase superfamily enzyme